MTGKILRLYPLPAQEISTIYEDLELPPPERRDASRPYVIINMVSSVDGKTAQEGKASPLGSQADRQSMRNLRSKADAVMVGASTVRAEKLSLGLDEAGQETQPLAVIVTGSGDVPLDKNLVVGERQEVLLVAPEGLTVRPGEHAILQLPAEQAGDIDLAEALKILRAEHAVDLLLVEGGPTLNYSLISDNLADELFLTLAPKLLGGAPDGALSIIKGPTQVARDVNLLTVHLASDELFLRYALS